MTAAEPTSIDDLVPAVLAGDPGAWPDLVGRVHPAIIAICRRRRLAGGPGGLDDTCRDVAARVIERLHADDYAALRRYRDVRIDYPNTGFIHWLAAIVGNTYIDYLRALPDYQRRRQDDGRALVALRAVPLAEADARARTRDDGDVLTQIQIRQILACLAADDFPALQRRALVLWLHGNSVTEIAAGLALGAPAEAHKLLHAARQRLRRAVHGASTARSLGSH